MKFFASLVLLAVVVLMIEGQEIRVESKTDLKLRGRRSVGTDDDDKRKHFYAYGNDNGGYGAKLEYDFYKSKNLAGYAGAGVHHQPGVGTGEQVYAGLQFQFRG